MSLVPEPSWGAEIALLGLVRERPLHGYEIYRRLSSATGLGLVWRVKQSQLYALLDKLEAEGYLVATLEPQEKAPPRKVLALTPKGGETYEKWVRCPVRSAREMRLDFLVKLYFAQQEDPETLRALVDAQRRMCETWLARLAAQPATTSFDESMWFFRIAQVEAMLRWLDMCVDPNTREK